MPAATPAFARPIFAAAFVAISLSTAGPSAASPSLSKALDFAETTLSGLCNDASRSRFVKRIGATRSRGCHLSLTPGRLMIEVRYRSANDENQPGRLDEVGVLRQELIFDRHAYFYCSSPENDGFSTFFMNCKGLDSMSDRSCTMEEWSRRSGTKSERTERHIRSFANILRAKPGTCRILKGAMNYIAERTRRSGANKSEIFFTR